MTSYKNPHEGETWDSLEARLCTPRQIAAAKKFAEKVGREIDARERLALARKTQVRTSRPQAEAYACF